MIRANEYVKNQPSLSRPLVSHGGKGKVQGKGIQDTVYVGYSLSCIRILVQFKLYEMLRVYSILAGGPDSAFETRLREHLQF